MLSFLFLALQKRCHTFEFLFSNETNLKKIIKCRCKWISSPDIKGYSDLSANIDPPRILVSFIFFIKKIFLLQKCFLTVHNTNKVIQKQSQPP